MRRKPIKPWVLVQDGGPVVATRHEPLQGGGEKLVASIRRRPIPHTANFEPDVYVALIHVSYPDMHPKEREIAERGQSIPVPPVPHTLQKIQDVVDLWLSEIHFDPSAREES